VTRAGNLESQRDLLSRRLPNLNCFERRLVQENEQHGVKLTIELNRRKPQFITDMMARNLCPDRERASIAVVAALIILFSTASASSAPPRERP
jgi:hypothetical protein